MSTNVAQRKSVLSTPCGLEGMVATFGNIFSYVRADHSLDPRWESDFLTRVALPFAIPLSWDKSRSVNHIRCHKLLSETLAEVFGEIEIAQLRPALTSFGGCFSFRPQRTGTKLSAHAWGIAVDLNPESNEQGTTGDMNAEVVAVFKRAGFAWGGDWEGKSRDPMHFQFCTGY